MMALDQPNLRALMDNVFETFCEAYDRDPTTADWLAIAEEAKARAKAPPDAHPMDTANLARVVCEKLACFGLVGVVATTGSTALRRVSPGDLAAAFQYGAPAGEHVLYQKGIGCSPFAYVKDADLRSEVLAALEDGATKVQVAALNLSPSAISLGPDHSTAYCVSVRARRIVCGARKADRAPQRSSPRGEDGMWSEFAWDP